MISVSFGADITTWGYLNYMDKYGFKGGISQPCPAAVSFVEHYLPELIPNLIPVQSPLMCAAIYANKVMGITDKMAFISPCIAKKTEIMSKRGKGLVSYNVTFNHLMKYVREHNIKGPLCTDEIEYGLGSVYPMPGGLKENIYWFLGEDAYVRQREGEGRMYHYLRANKDRIKEGDIPYLLIDVLNCEQGCLYGTGTEKEKNETDDVFMEMLNIKAGSKNSKPSDAWSKMLSPKDRLSELNRQFANLDLNDYLCEYTDLSATCKYSIPSKEELDNIFNDMGKTMEEARKINCSCCGYETCEEMAMAIYNGFNHKENCIHYRRVEIFAHEGIKRALQSGTPEKSINSILEYIGESFAGERVFVLEKNDEGGIDAAYEWVAEGSVSGLDNIDEFPPDIVTSLNNAFIEDKNVIISKLEDIKKLMPENYKYLKSKDIHSLVAIPLRDEGKVIGSYGIVNSSNQSFEHVTELMQIIGYFIVNCIHRRKMLDRVQELSFYDQLTHLGNRHAMQRCINDFSGKKNIGVVFCDVTGLKEINDTKGHKSGDELLVRTAECLKKVFGEYNLFRIGGDEFLAMDFDVRKSAMEEKVKLLKDYSKSCDVILAVGCAWSNKENVNINQLINESETIMYKDKSDYYKSTGRDRRRR